MYFSFQKSLRILLLALVAVQLNVYAQTTAQRLQLANQGSASVNAWAETNSSSEEYNPFNKSNSGVNQGPVVDRLNVYTPSVAVPELSKSIRPRVAEKPTQFQNFVQQSTGRLLPIFGANLFEQPESFNPVTNIAPPNHYVLGAGDEIALNIWGGLDLSLKLVVDSRGQIYIPRVGNLSLAGIAVGQLESTLRSYLNKTYKNIEISATLSKLRNIQVYIVGQAQRPGTYTLPSLSTVVTAVFMSGGPNPNGSMREIQLRRAGKLVAKIDLYDFIANGVQVNDISLQAGDVVVIPPAGPRVAIVGAYDNAAIYELTSQHQKIEDLLRLGGGVPKLATPQIAILERIQSKQPISRFVQEIELKDKGLSTALEDGDVLTLLPISAAFANAITLKGAVAQPIRRAWQAGLRLKDIIPDAQSLLTPEYVRRQNAQVQMVEPVLEENNARYFPLPKNNLDQDNTRYQNQEEQAALPFSQAQNAFQNQPLFKGNKPALPEEPLAFNRMYINWDYAIIERTNAKTLQVELIPFNLGLLLKNDEQQNLLLEPGDVVTIFSHKDMRLPETKRNRLVRVEGEVAAPGVYQALPGETLPQLLRRIGGVTPQAYLFGLEFSREEVRKQQQQNLDKLITQLENSLQSQTGESISNLSVERVGQVSTLVEMQRKSQEQKLNRLKALRSNGRVALELPVQNARIDTLPAIALEDGDRILIPSAPSFVSAFGAVNNENVFVYRKGRSVNEVLHLAGLTEDADASQAFVLRADGTVVAKRDQSGFFGIDGFEGMELMPGDTVVVPYKVDRESRWSLIMRGLKDWTQILSNLGLGVAAWRSL